MKNILSNLVPKFRYMGTQLVTDYTGEPVAMVVDYKDWVKIARKLNLPAKPATTVKERNPLDWYQLTESLNSILNGIIALTAREEMKELDQVQPDLAKVDELVRLRNEVWEVNSNPLNFKNPERMEDLISKYSPLLLLKKREYANPDEQS